MTWPAWLVAYLATPFALVALWIIACETIRARDRRRAR